ncbi:MAG: hypothetical protein NTU62_01930 [Spirochaetes bacterium]|nr:hypothetical protein [Spirochaetota bacterium]
MRFVLLAILCLLAAGTVGAQSTPAAPPVGILKKGSAPRVEMDLDEDGRIDYVLVNNAKGLPEHEEFDYNHDGAMDDFLYYDNGMAAREEIDSDYDGKIDIWVHLSEGRYIRRWERDLDGDGKPDKFQDF